MKTNSSQSQDVSRKIIRIIPDKLFYELWTDATSMNEIDFHTKYLQKDYCSKYSLSPRHFFDLLVQVFELAHISLKEIIELSGLTKLQVRNRFCFPNRTFNAWYYGQNECPAYTRLMLLRNLHLAKLVHHIYTESEFPGYREKQNKTNTELEVQSRTTESNNSPDHLIPDDDFSFKLWEQEHVKHHNDEVQRLLKSLEYLDRR